MLGTTVLTDVLCGFKFWTLVLKVFKNRVLRQNVNEKREYWTLKSFVLTRLRLKRDGTRAVTRFRLSAKRTGPFKSAGASVQSTTGCRVVRISGSNAGYTCSEVVWRVLATHSIRQFPLQFPSCASPCAITFQLDFTSQQIHLLCDNS
jgi:hypothetical protein